MKHVCSSVMRIDYYDIRQGSDVIFVRCNQRIILLI